MNASHCRSLEKGGIGSDCGGLLLLMSTVCSQRGFSLETMQIRRSSPGNLFRMKGLMAKMLFVVQLCF